MGFAEYDDADWAEWFEERAAILEFDGGLSRAEAEAEAQRIVDETRARYRPVEQAEMFETQREKRPARPMRPVA